MPQLDEETCHCPVYKFPHRYASGKCSGATYVCAACNEPCHPRQIDQGIGSYECHGFQGTHHEYVVASDCCEAEVLALPGGATVESLDEFCY